MTVKQRLIASLAAAFAFAFYFAGVLPVQTYRAYADTFTYTLGALLGDLVLPFALTFVLAAALLYFLSRWFGTFLHLLLLALVVAALVEAGPLSIGLPELNGDFSGYHSLTRACVDGAILLLLVVMPLVFYRVVRTYTIWIALAVAFYSVASLFDVKTTEKDVSVLEDYIVPETQSREDVINSIEFSPKRNVMVLLLDNISADACEEVFVRHPELTKHFSGFVNYANNLGMQCATKPAVPGIFTGKYWNAHEESFDHYVQSIFMKDSFIKAYSDSAIYISPGSLEYGYTNRLKHDGEVRACQSPLATRSSEFFELSIVQLSLFRILPFYSKGACALNWNQARQKEEELKNGNREMSHFTAVNSDQLMWPYLADCATSKESKAFFFIHTEGGHFPISKDENGNRITILNPSRDNYVSLCVYVFKQVAAFLDRLQTRGLYDGSAIIICADHGCGQSFLKKSSRLAEAPGGASPCLMVKPICGHEEYHVSSIPTSHAKMAQLLRDFATEDLSYAQIDNIVKSPVRFFRDVHAPIVKDYYVTDDGKVTLRQGESNELCFDKIEPIELDVKYYLNPALTTKKKPYPQFVLRGGARTQGLGLMNLARQQMSLGFKAPEANRVYNAMIELTLTRPFLTWTDSIEISGGISTVLVRGRQETVMVPVRVISSESRELLISFSADSKSVTFSPQSIVFSSIDSPLKSLVKVEFDPNDGQLADNLRYVRCGGNYGENANLYSGRRPWNFTRLSSAVIEKDMLHLEASDTTTNRLRFIDYFIAPIKGVVPGAPYTYVLEVHKFDGEIAGWHIGQSANTNSCHAQLEHVDLGKSFQGGETRFVPVVATQWAAIGNVADRAFIRLDPGQSLDAEVRVSVFAGRAVNASNYHYYVQPGDTMPCPLPVPSRSGYVFDGWYDGEQRISATTRVLKREPHTLTAHWRRK